MKTQIQNNLLSFNKSSMIELNDLQLRNTDSGVTPATPGLIGLTTFVVAGAIGVTMRLTD